VIVAKVVIPPVVEVGRVEGTVEGARAEARRARGDVSGQGGRGGDRRDGDGDADGDDAEDRQAAAARRWLHRGLLQGSWLRGAKYRR
jgi:hypothetical protein